MTARAAPVERPFVRHGYAAALVAVAAVWGATFPIVKESVERVAPFEFLALRFTLAALVMTSVFPRQLRKLDRDGWRAGLAAGLALFAGYAFQTIGLQYTRSSNAGFVTGLFVVFAPILSALFLRRVPSVGAGAGAILATGGLALLSLTNHLEVHKGDAIVLFAALSFAAQIVLLARSAPRHSPAALTTVQMWVAAIGSAVVMPAAGDLRTPDGYVWMALAITAVFASAAGFLIQTAAQRHIGPTRTAVILVSEPAFAGLFGFLLRDETLSARGWAGAALILAAMLTAELWPWRGPARA